MSTQPTVVVPWDFSQHSHAALDYAIEKHGAESVRVICVLERPNVYEMGWGGEEEEEKAIERSTQSFRTETERLQDQNLHFFTVFGDPSDEIVRFTKEQNADCIVMSTHGRTSLQKLFLGSVAQKVIAKAPCPVVVLPAFWGNDGGSH